MASSPLMTCAGVSCCGRCRRPHPASFQHLRRPASVSSTLSFLKERVGTQFRGEVLPARAILTPRAAYVIIAIIAMIHKPVLSPSSPPPAAPSAAPRWSGITVRAWVIGLLLIPLLDFWLEYTEIVAEGPDLAAMSLPMAVLFALLVLVGINLAVKRFQPKWALSQAELLFIYTMNTVAIYIGGIGMMQFLTPTLVGWKHFQTPQNKWNSWEHFVPKWATPNPAVIPGYYAGRTTFFMPETLLGWAQPIAVWTGFIVTLLFCFYCLAALLRKQWVDRERLIFPMVIIPLEITRDGGSTPLWHNKLLWLGVGIPAVLESMAAIHFTLVPTFPYIPIKPEYSLQLETGITTPPWNAIGYTPMAFYPLVIGLAYLLSLEVSFSCWFFYLFAKVQTVIVTAFGFRDPGAGPTLAHMPYIAEQGVGAFLGLALFSLYLARTQLSEAWRKAFRGDTSVDDSNEPLSYRVAYIGLFVSFAALVGFTVALGLSLVVALIFWVLLLLLALTFTRIRAEAGLPWGQAPWGLTHGTMVSFAGTEAFTPRELTGFSFVRWFDSDWRCLAQPAEIEAMKIADTTMPRPMNPRHLTIAIFVAILVGTLAAWVSCLAIYYHYGAANAKLDVWRTGQGHYGFDELQGWLTTAHPLDSGRISASAVGLIVVVLLGFLRTRFPWWPLHPIGYAVGSTDTMTWIWFPVLLGWLSKSLILRYGGVKLYRQALPFFIGLVLGDYGISGLWALYFLASGHSGYRTFPI